MSFIIRIYANEIYEYVFRIFAILGVQEFSLKIYGDCNIEPYCLYVCIYPRSPHPLAEIYRDMGIRDVFRAVAVTKNISGF